MNIRLVLLPMLWPLLVPSAAPACGPFFYAAAPALTPGEMSYSIRTLASLHDLTTARNWTREQADALAVELMDAAAAALAAPKDEALATLEKLQQRNRAGAYRAATANFLTDLADLVRAAVPAEPRGAYVTARRALTAQDTGIATVQPRNAPFVGEPWMTPAEKDHAAARHMAREDEKAVLAAEVEAVIAAAPPELQPFQQVQGAARQFRGHDFAAALLRFEKVVQEYPDHPRAETAAFMALRCRIELVRDAAQRAAPAVLPSSAFTAAWEARRAFAEKYPQSRFAADLPGWDGALHFIAGRYDAAFVSYAGQAEVKDHPEVVRQALHEAEQCLLKLNGTDADPRQLRQAAEALPAFPRAAMRMVYFVLEPAGTVDYAQWPWMQDEYVWEGGIQERDRLARRWRIRAEGRQFLRALVQGIQQQRGSERVPEWDPFSLAVVAWQATEDGDHLSALGLCRRWPALVAQSDDLQTVRAIALQRAGRAEEAIAAWRALVAQFPRSPLASQATQRLVALLHDARRPAEALVLIMESEAAEEAVAAARLEAAQQGLFPPAPVIAIPRPGPDLPALLQEDLRQWRDMLALLSPLPDLEKEHRRASAGVKTKLAALLAVRWLSTGEPEKARPYMQEPDPPPDVFAVPGPEDSRRRSLPQPLPRTATGWGQWFEPLAAAHRSAARFHGTDAARAWLDAGKQWAALRREFHLRTAQAVYMNSEFRQAELRLRRNATALGWPADKVNEALLREDFLAPAMDCWQRAIAAAPQSEAAAEALVLSNDALLQRAELTPFTMQAADECGWSAQSAALVEKLRRHPRAGKWQHTEVVLDFSRGQWLPGNVSPPEVNALVIAALTGAATGDPAPLPADFNPAHAAMEAFDHGGRPAVAKVLEELRQTARAAIAGTGCAALNRVEAIADSLAKQDVSDAALRAWWEAEAGGKTGEFPDAAFDDLRTYYEVRDAALIFPGQTNRSPEAAGRWRDWLAKYPQSPRREAALFQLTRVICRSARGATHFENRWWGEGGPLPGSMYPVIVTVRDEPPASAAEAAQALREYQTAFPHSRYAADIQLLEGSAALERGDYGRALDLLIPLTDNAGHRELHTPAALHLADLFLRLLDAAQRPPVVAALESRPSARAKLRRFMDSATPGGRLVVFRALAGE